MAIQNQDRDDAAQHLDAVEIIKDTWVYLPDEINTYYTVTSEDLVKLGQDLRLNTPDAYSLWCTVCGSESYDDEIAAYEAIRWGVRCEAIQDDMPITGQKTVTIQLTLTKDEADELPYHLIKACSAWAKEAEKHWSAQSGQTEIRDGQTLRCYLYEMSESADSILRKVNGAINA